MYDYLIKNNLKLVQCGINYVDIDGNYIINITSSKAVLTFSYLGYTDFFCAGLIIYFNL